LIRLDSQGIAKKGNYGSFLMDNMELIYKLVNTAHRHCNVPITAKMRVFDDDDKSLQYAKMLQDAGAQIITVHGRSSISLALSCAPRPCTVHTRIDLCGTPACLSCAGENWTCRAG